MNAIIQDIMRPFGVTPRYAGFPMLVASVELYLEGNAFPDVIP